jgi:hypothetical protein
MLLFNLAFWEVKLFDAESFSVLLERFCNLNYALFYLVAFEDERLEVSVSSETSANELSGVRG